MKHCGYPNLEEVLYMPDEYINIRIPMDASGDIENEIAKGVRRVCSSLRASASQVVSGYRIPYRGLTPEDYANELYVRADALSYQLTDPMHHRACFNKSIGRQYVRTDQLRLVLVRIVLPFMHLDADPNRLIQDLELAIGRRIRSLREEASSESSRRVNFRNRDRQYFVRMAKSLESVRLEYVESPDNDESPSDYHLIRDGKHGSKIRTRERYDGTLCPIKMKGARDDE